MKTPFLALCCLLAMPCLEAYTFVLNNETSRQIEVSLVFSPGGVKQYIIPAGSFLETKQELPITVVYYAGTSYTGTYSADVTYSFYPNGGAKASYQQ